MSRPSSDPGGELDLEAWIARQRVVSAKEMGRAVSATHIVKHRPDFGQSVVPRPGSVVASTRLANWDPEPDYFFHWLRDSALVMGAATALVVERGAASPWVRRFEDFVRFSLDLTHLDGREAANIWDVSAVAPEVRKFLRPPEDLAKVHGATVDGEVRFNPDGTLDRQLWARPQYDGPALRALAVDRHLRQTHDLQPRPHGRRAQEAMRRLLWHDLRFVLAQARAPGYDLWEERLGRHYDTCLVQCAALRLGQRLAEAEGLSEFGQACAAEATALLAELDGLWSAEDGHYRAHGIGQSDDNPAHGRGNDLDMAAVLAVLHAEFPEGPHSVLDPRAQATIGRLEAHYRQAFAIPPDSAGFAAGRYPGDVYAGGSAWYITTFAAAEFHYKLAELAAAGGPLRGVSENRDFLDGLLGAETDSLFEESGALGGEGKRRVWGRAFAKADAILAFPRKTVGPEGQLSEQFDPATGQQTSAKELAWSHAAFLSMASARDRARVIDSSL
jgi:glucoamylase